MKQARWKVPTIVWGVVAAGILTLALAALAPGAVDARLAQTDTPEALAPEELRLQLEAFDIVWTTIRDKHYDPTFGGLDWNAVRDELRPRVERATSKREARAAMHEMIRRLDLTHFNIFPEEILGKMGSTDGPGEGEPEGVLGIDLRVLHGHAIVRAVDEGSTAEQAGVRAGWEIVRIDGEDVSEWIRDITAELEGKTILGIVLAGAVGDRLTGKIGESRTVTFLDGEDRPVDLEIPLAEGRGERVQFGFFPVLKVWIDTRRMDDVGYIAFKMFLDPPRVMKVFNEAMESYLDARGVVIDLRGNGGGIGAMGMGMAGWFVREEGKSLGTMRFREQTLEFPIFARRNAFRGPLAILVDEMSGSSSECLAGGLQALGRARIFGTRTAGGALPSVIERLPNGDAFQYAIADFVSADGKRIEGVGITPDDVVEPTRRDWLEGRDPVLEAALEWIRRTE